MTDLQVASIHAILRSARRIAVVGLSDNSARASYGVAAALHARGYEIVPVNPNLDTWRGITAYPALEDVPGHVDLVDVFRREEHCPAVARSAVAIGADALWLQLGIESVEAEATATDAGLVYVEDRCLKVEVARYASDLRLPPAAA